VRDSAAASKAIFELLKLFTDTIPRFVDPIFAAISAALEALDNLLNDLINTGGFLLVIPPQRGGLNGFGNFVRVALSNDRLIDRPRFTEDAFVAAFGGFAFAPDNLVAQTFATTFNRFLSADEFIRRKSGVEALVSTATFRAHDTKFKLARSASPIEDGPWVSVSAAKFIPKAGDLVADISSYLRGINRQVKSNPFDDFIRLTDQIIANADQFADDIEETADFIDASFPDLPIKFFKVDPQSGGTDAVFESTKDWFNRQAHIEDLEDVPENSFITGFFVYIGGPDLSTVTEQLTVWETLLLPEIT